MVELSNGRGIKILVECVCVFVCVCVCVCVVLAGGVVVGDK